MRFHHLHLGLCAAFVLAWATQANAQTTVSGYTLKYAGGMEKEYPGVEVTAYRQGPVSSTTSTAPDGQYNLSVPSGSPFYLLFEDPQSKHLPELQNLSGRSVSKHIIDVTLLTPQEAKALGIDPYQHLKRLIETLRELGAPAEDLRRLSALLGKLG